MSLISQIITKIKKENIQKLMIFLIMIALVMSYFVVFAFAFKIVAAIGVGNAAIVMKVVKILKKRNASKNVVANVSAVVNVAFVKIFAIILVY